MLLFNQHIKYVIFVFVAILITACSSGSCDSSNANNSNPPIVVVLPNSGEATLTIPVSRLSIPLGSTTTSTSISLNGGTPGLVINLSGTIVQSQTEKTVENNLISVLINPESLVAGGVVNSSTIQISLNANLPAGIYNVNLYARYLVNNVESQVHIGTIVLTFSGVAPTPVAGVLSLNPESISMTPDKDVYLTLTLSNSSLVSNLVVDISVESTSIATITPITCTLSTESNICTINVSGISYGNTIIITNADGYESVAANVSVQNPWSQLGNVPSAGYFLSIIQDESGNTYAGGQSFSNSPDGGVWVWNGASWSQLGSNVTSVVGFTSIIKDKLSDNIIYAGGKSQNNTGVLWMWDGNSWSQVGDAIESVYQFTDIIQDDMGNIYASFQPALNLPQTAGVWKWDGSNWSELGGGNVESALIFTSIIHDESGNIYAAGSVAGTNYAGAWKWDGSSWTQLGGNVTLANTFRSIIQDKSGNIYVAGTAVIGFLNIRGCVWKWDGTTWSQVGGSNISSVSSFGSLAQDESGNIYAGGQSTSPSTGVVWKWDGSSWTQLGSNVTSANAFISILMDNFGDIYAGGATNGTTYGGLWLYHP